MAKQTVISTAKLMDENVIGLQRKFLSRHPPGAALYDELEPNFSHPCASIHRRLRDCQRRVRNRDRRSLHRAPLYVPRHRSAAFGSYHSLWDKHYIFARGAAVGCRAQLSHLL